MLVKKGFFERWKGGSDFQFLFNVQPKIYWIDVDIHIGTGQKFSRTKPCNSASYSNYNFIIHLYVSILNTFGMHIGTRYLVYIDKTVYIV